MQAFKRSEGLAFCELLDRYKNSIFGFVRRRVNSCSSAETATSSGRAFGLNICRIALNRVAD